MCLTDWELLPSLWLVSPWWWGHHNFVSVETKSSNLRTNRTKQGHAEASYKNLIIKTMADNACAHVSELIIDLIFQIAISNSQSLSSSFMCRQSWLALFLELYLLLLLRLSCMAAISAISLKEHKTLWLNLHRYVWLTLLLRNIFTSLYNYLEYGWMVSWEKKKEKWWLELYFNHTGLKREIWILPIIHSTLSKVKSQQCNYIL